MRKVLIIQILLSFFSITSGLCQIKIIKHDTIVLVENTLMKVGKNVNFTVLPGPAQGTTEKIGFVVLPMLVYNLKKSDTLSPPSSTALMIYFDFYGSWMTSVKQSFYWNDNKWRAFITTGIGQMRLKFFGLSPQGQIISNDDSNYVWTRQAGFNAGVSCFRKIYKGLYGGLEYSYQLSDLKGEDSLSSQKLSESGVPLGQQSESTFVPSFVWDNRDNIFWTTKGYYACLNLKFANAAIFSSSDYSIVSGRVSGYHKLLKNSNKLILAWFFYTQTGWGNMSFLNYSNYGQGDEVTGYTPHKYVDFSEATVQTELRYEIWKFISCGGYAGTGKVFPAWDVFGQSAWLHFGGLRVYVNILPSRNIRLKLDLAVARKDWGFYLGIGQAF